MPRIPRLVADSVGLSDLNFDLLALLNAQRMMVQFRGIQGSA